MLPANRLPATPSTETGSAAGGDIHRRTEWKGEQSLNGAAGASWSPRGTPQ